MATRLKCMLLTDLNIVRVFVLLLSLMLPTGERHLCNWYVPIHGFLPCIPCKALMRVHFTDNFMTLTISPCNRIFKMAPCLHSGGWEQGCVLPPLPAAETSLPRTMALKYQKVNSGLQNCAHNFDHFYFPSWDKSQNIFFKFMFYILGWVLLFWVNSKYCKDVFKDRQF